MNSQPYNNYEVALFQPYVLQWLLALLHLLGMLTGLFRALLVFRSVLAQYQSEGLWS